MSAEDSRETPLGRPDTYASTIMAMLSLKSLTKIHTTISEFASRSGVQRMHKLKTHLSLESSKVLLSYKPAVDQNRSLRAWPTSKNAPFLPGSFSVSPPPPHTHILFQQTDI